MGQTALKKEQSTLDRDLFDRDDTSEVTDNVISMAHIFRAEDSLGHAVINMNDVQDAHIEHTDNVIQHLFKTVKNYSIDDTTTEQRGGPSDADLTTAGGYLKQGKQDPDAHESKKIKKRTTADLRFINQQTEQASITRQLAALDELIAASREKIAALDVQINEIDAVQEMLENGEDIDGSSPGSKGARRRINRLLSNNGKSLDDYKDDNGVIDRQRLADDLARMKQELIVERDREQEKADNLEEEKNELEGSTHEAIKVAVETDNSEAVKVFAQDPTNNPARPAEILPVEERVALVQEHTMVNKNSPSSSTGMGLLAFFGFGEEEETTLTASTENSETLSDASQTLASTGQEKTTEQSFGSFATLNEIKDSVIDNISSIFTQASDPTTDQNTEVTMVAEAKEEYTQQQVTQQPMASV